jgi:hypothetical protein
MRIVGRWYKAGRFTYVGNPSGTGRIFGRLKAVASIGDRSNIRSGVGDGTYRSGGLGMGTGPINRPVKRQESIGDRSNLGPAQMGHSLVTVSYPFRGPCELTRPQLNAAI